LVFLLPILEYTRSDFIELEITRKLTEKFHLEKSNIEELIYRFRNLTYYTNISTELPALCMDVDDNYILQTCQSAEADMLITGDKELQLLKAFIKTKIISPSQFMDEYVNNQ